MSANALLALLPFQRRNRICAEEKRGIDFGRPALTTAIGSNHGCKAKTGATLGPVESFDRSERYQGFTFLPDNRQTLPASFNYPGSVGA
jgi:hypothetical protein